MPPTDQEAGTPTWVKVFGVTALLFAIAFAALHLTGRGLGAGMHGAHAVDAGSAP